jgi:hypothetical protein
MSSSFLTSPEQKAVVKEVLLLKEAGHTGEVTIFSAIGCGDDGEIYTGLIDEESFLYEILSECLEDGWEVHGAGSTGEFKVDFDNEVISTSFYYWAGADNCCYARQANIHEYDFDGQLISTRDVSGECQLLDHISNRLNQSNILDEAQDFISKLSWEVRYHPENFSIETIYTVANKIYEHFIALIEHVMSCFSEFDYVEIENEEDSEVFYYELIPGLLTDYLETFDSLVNLLSDLLLILINNNQSTDLENDDSLLSLLNKIESFKDSPIWDSEWEIVTEIILDDCGWFTMTDENFKNWKKNIIS